MTTIVGVDVGGTFTDFFVLDARTGESSVFKTPSTPADPSVSIAAGLQTLLDRGALVAGSINRVAHGTTVGTNALLERKGAKVVLVVTRGFRDLLEIGRQTRPHLYSLQADSPEPLVPRERRLEVPERVLANGDVAHSLNSDDIQKLIAELQDIDAESVAVCLLFSFLNPVHEQRLKAAIEAACTQRVSISSEVQPEFREYERMSTTVLNSYLQPVMSGYLAKLEATVQQLSPGASLRINQSSGGLMSADQAAKFPVRTALSGPAAGVVGAHYVMRSAGRSNVVTLDMGGTSADVCLIRNQSLTLTYEGEVGGFPVRLPMVDVNAVGAGGGSIVWIDRDGLMKVGPVSAGANPGPACYGLGGMRPTVTDANLILGRLSPRGLLDGQLPLNQEAARAAFQDVASRVGTTVQRAALGCLEIVVANMARAIRTVSVERGHDPKGFALLAFGGGGPLHARAVAASLGIGEIIVPPYPGILCAQGLLAARISEAWVLTRRIEVGPQSQDLVVEAIASLRQRADAWFDDENVAPSQRTIETTLDMRYRGQNYELSVPVDADNLSSASSKAAVELLHQSFKSAHERLYGTCDEEGTVEVVNVRVTAKIDGIPLRSPERGRLHVGAPPEPKGVREVYFDPSAPIDCPIFDRSDLLPGMGLQGPAIVEQIDTTTIIYPGDRLRVDEVSNLIIEVGA